MELKGYDWNRIYWRFTAEEQAEIHDNTWARRYRPNTYFIDEKSLSRECYMKLMKNLGIRVIPENI